VFSKNSVASIELVPGYGVREDAHFGDKVKNRSRVAKDLLRARTGHETDVVTRAIIDLGMQLGLEVVAEGVETDVELAKLQAIGCKLGQGYLFAPPRADSVPPLFRGPVQAAFRDLLQPVLKG